jgi:L,D-transpeptidase catalytic domain
MRVVSTREGLGPLVVLAFVASVAMLLPAQALAGDKPPKPPEYGPAPTTPTPPPPAGQTSMQLKLKGDKGGKVRVGKRVQVLGTLRPWQPGQQVTVTLQRGDREVKQKVASVSQGEGDAGHFQVRSPVLVQPGHYHATAELAGKSGTARSGKFKIRYPSLHHGSRGKDVKLFNRLLDKQGYVPSNGRRYTARTARAVLAYRKVHGMARITRATSGIFKTLADGRGGYKLKHPGAGKHVEVSIGRQVMVLADNGKAQRTYPVSTGKASTPTVRGHFRFYRRQPGFNAVGMYYSVYFHGGYAIHGYRDVPARYPASHGCVRTPIPDAVSIYNWVQIGMSIYVY